MNRTALVRLLSTAAVLGAALALGGCDTDSIVLSNSKANTPIAPRLLSEMEKKNMDPQSPILIRVFKQEAELEVWKQNREGRYDILQTYPICRWSGDLGPKIREGDRQAPEGFYAITPAQMNPQSQYFLSFNTGFPNAFDKSLGRTGSELMVHGDCSSRGCYAMTDEQISQIYALGRESFFGGQRAFQFQAYPFKMTAENLAKHRNNPNMPFWKMIKEGNDHFLLTRQEPKVDVCEKHYVFDAQAPAGSTRPLNFSPAARCPAYEIAPDVAEAVRAKQAQDDAAVAQLTARGVPVARMNTGIDGGMHTVFASKLPNGSTGLSENGDKPFSMVAYAPAPGTIPDHVNPPRKPEDVSADQSGTGFSFLRSSTPAPAAVATPVPTAARPVAPPAKPATAIARTEVKPAEAPVTRTATAQPALPSAKPAPQPATSNFPPTQPPAAQAAPATATASATPQGQSVPGSQPVVQGNSFSNRWSAFQ